jgi:hypothetical protein
MRNALLILVGVATVALLAGVASAQVTSNWWKADGDGPDAAHMVINMPDFSMGPTITIDGDVDDWPDGMDIRDIAIGHPSYPGPDDPQNYHGTWMAGYDAERDLIYVAIVVYDNESIPDNSAWNSGDNMELYIDAMNANLGGYDPGGWEGDEGDYPDGFEYQEGKAGYGGYNGAQQWSMNWGVPPLKLLCHNKWSSLGIEDLTDEGFHANYTSAEKIGITDVEGATGGGTEWQVTIYEVVVPALEGDATVNYRGDTAPGMWIGIDCVVVDRDTEVQPSGKVISFNQFGPFKDKYTQAGSMENGWLGPIGSAAGITAVESATWGAIKAQF